MPDSTPRIEHLRQQIHVLIDTDESLEDIFDLLISVTGIADVSTIQFLGEPLVLPKEMQAKQWGTAESVVMIAFRADLQIAL